MVHNDEALEAIPTHYTAFAPPSFDGDFYSASEIEIHRDDLRRHAEEARALARERGREMHPRVVAIRANALAEACRQEIRKAGGFLPKKKGK